MLLLTMTEATQITTRDPKVFRDNSLNQLNVPGQFLELIIVFTVGAFFGKVIFIEDCCCELISAT